MRWTAADKKPEMIRLGLRAAVEFLLDGILRIGFERDIHACAILQRDRVAIQGFERVLNPNLAKKVVRFCNGDLHSLGAACICVFDNFLDDARESLPRPFWLLREPVIM